MDGWTDSFDASMEGMESDGMRWNGIGWMDIGMNGWMDGWMDG